MIWIDVKYKLPPKDTKFLFAYYYGIGLGEWAQTYQTVNGNSETSDHKYVLILWPSEIVAGSQPFEWDEQKMIEMDVFWACMPLYTFIAQDQ